MKNKHSKKLIRIKVTYLSKDLQQITGKKKEVIRVPQTFTSGDFFDLLQERYPEIFKKFGPGYLGFTLNKEEPHVLTLLKNGDHYEFTTWTDEEILEDELAKQFIGKEAVAELPKREFKMPKWMECTWRRIPCGEDNCPICGQIKRDRQRHIERGEDPDDLKNVFEDVSQKFKEVLEIIKKDAKSKRFNITNIENIKEPPEPKEFPFYNEGEKWNKSVMVLGDNARALDEFWIHTEEAADLFWYANTLMTKTYRQLCNKWHIENGDDYGELDHRYTGYVLKECLKILKKSLRKLVNNNYPQKIELNSTYSNLLKLEKEIIKI